MTLDVQALVDRTSTNIGAEIGDVDLFRPISLNDLAVDRDALFAPLPRAIEEAGYCTRHLVERPETVHDFKSCHPIRGATAQVRTRSPESGCPVSA